MSAKLILIIGVAAVSAQSWQSYVDDQLIGAGMEKGVIFGLDGEILGQSSNIEPTIDEMQRIVEQFDDPWSIYATGILLDKIRFFGIKGDSSSLYGKKGAGGIVCVKTGQAIICGIYDYTLQPGNAATIVERLGDYFRDSGN